MDNPATDLRIRIVPRATLALIIVCGALYAFEAARFGWSPTAPELHLIGGLSSGSIEVGRWWSLVVGNLLHADAGHLVVNLGMIIYLGWFVEWAWGARVMLLVLVAGLVGADLASLAVHPELTSIGASGLLAALVGFGLAQPIRIGLQAFILRLVSVRIALFGLGDYLIGRASDDPGAVNNAAHVGGLVGGVIVALVLWSRRVRVGRGLVVLRRAGLVLASSCIVVALAGAVPHVAKVNEFAWVGVGSDRPDALPPPELLELVLDGIALDDLGAVRDPSCSASGDSTTAACAVRVIDGDRTASIELNRSDIHLDFRFVEVGGDSVADGVEDGVTGDEEDRTDDAILLVRQLGVDVGRGARMQVGEVECEIVSNERASCRGTYVGHVVPIDVDYVGDEPSVTIGRTPRNAVPTTSAQVTAAIEGLVVPSIGEGITLTRVRGCSPDSRVKSARWWTCSDTVLDDEEPRSIPFRFGTDGKFIGGGGFMYPAVRFRSIRPASVHDIARRIATFTASKVEVELRGRRVKRLSDAEFRTVSTADCERFSSSTPAPDFTCGLEFEEGGFAAVFVEPGDRFQIEPVSPALGSAVEAAD